MPLIMYGYILYYQENDTCMPQLPSLAFLNGFGMDLRYHEFYFAVPLSLPYPAMAEARHISLYEEGIIARI